MLKRHIAQATRHTKHHLEGWKNKCVKTPKSVDLNSKEYDCVCYRVLKPSHLAEPGHGNASVISRTCHIDIVTLA